MGVNTLYVIFSFHLVRAGHTVLNIYTESKFLSVTLHVTLVQKVKHMVYKILAFINEAISCLDPVIYFIKKTSTVQCFTIRVDQFVTKYTSCFLTTFKSFFSLKKSNFAF